jgi:Patatin-like phospholipase
MTANANDTFYVGFALSGAISAGAYTAGVLDFFFQALNEWEKARGVAGTPTHRVDLQVVTGASAGAITGALGVVALARGIRPQKLSAAEKQNTHPIESETAQDLRCVLPSLYETWVTRPRAVDPNGGIDFLSAEDLEGGKDAAVVSVLNAELLDRIKEKALLAPASGQAPEAQPPYAYIAENLHVYMTVSNLRGIPFTVSFGNSTYGMQTHGDRVHYTISGLGNAVSIKNKWVCADTSEPLTLSTLPPVGEKELPDTWDRYGTCALASSAFPIGLAPRQIAAPINGYKKRSYPIARGEAALEPNFPKPWLAGLGSKGFVFLNVDGGIINNNPFDYAQYALIGDSMADKTGAEDSDRAVIMVSPFPEPPGFLPDEQPATELVAVIRALFPALINQSRFKTTELVPALDPNNHSRFLIAPQRKIDGIEQRYTIACGLLGGFGGFLDEKFRAHDFQLGRRNCQAFLRSTFGLSPDSDVVASLRGQKEFELSATPGQYAVIPRLGEALPEVALPKWPRMSQADFTVLMRRIKGRLSKLAPRFVQAQTASRFFRALGRIGLWLGQDRVLEYVRLAILSDLVRRDQIEGWELPPMPGKSLDDVRLVLAELANPAFTFRTVDGIAKRTHLDPAFVTSSLAQLETVDDSRPFLVWQGKFEGRQVFTLASRKPGWLRSLPGISQILNLLEAPTID